MMIRLCAFLLLSSWLSVVGCKSNPNSSAVPRINRAAPYPTPPSDNFLHKTFAVSGYAHFGFQVPPHQINPHVQGNFHAFIGNTAGRKGQDADVNLMLMNQRQLEEFLYSRGGSPTYSVEASRQSVDIALPPTIQKPVNYYIVFQNPPGATARRVVQADFTVSY